MLDDITQAVLAREDVARYLRGGHGQTELEARERIQGYLDELRTTQRYPIYRALKHPLYPILRKIERIDEGVEIAGSLAQCRIYSKYLALQIKAMELGLIARGAAKSAMQ